MSVTSGTYANASIRATDTATTSTKIIECTGWTMTREGVEGAYASNNTAGYRRRVIGTKDAKGTIKGVYDPATPIEAVIAVGDRVFLQLHVPSSTATIGHKFYARITGGPDYDGDIEEGKPSTWSCGYAIDDSAPAFNSSALVAPS